MSAKKDRNKSSKNKLFIGLVLLVVAIIIFLTFYLFYTNNPIISTITQPAAQKRTDGKVEIFTDNYTKAMDAWRKGDKAAAKIYAQRVIDENNSLSVENQGNIQGQADKMDEMADIVGGKNPL